MFESIIDKIESEKVNSVNVSFSDNNSVTQNVVIGSSSTKKVTNTVITSTDNETINEQPKTVTFKDKINSLKKASSSVKRVSIKETRKKRNIVELW